MSAIDKAAPENKGIFRYLEERRENSSLDSYFSICACGNYQETAQFRPESLHNSPNSERDNVRANTYNTSTYKF